MGWCERCFSRTPPISSNRVNEVCEQERLLFLLGATRITKLTAFDALAGEESPRVQSIAYYVMHYYDQSKSHLYRTHLHCQ